MQTGKETALQKLDSILLFYEKHKSTLCILSLSAMTLTGMVLFIWGTAKYGIGIRTDSVDYLWSAKNFARGIGLGTLNAFGKLMPMNHYPPLYPILLSVFERSGMDAMAGARWLGAVLFGILVVLFGVVLLRLTNRSFWFPTIGVLVLLFTPDLWTTSLYAMTEPLYVVCSLLGFLCLDNYYLWNNRRWMLIASVLFGLALLSRYVGIAVIVTGAMILLIMKGHNFKHRIGDIGIMGSIAILPLLAWVVRNIILTGSATNRGIHFVPILAPEWHSVLEAIGTWTNLIGEWNKARPLELVVFFMSLLVGFLILRGKRISESTKTSLPAMLACYATFYALFVVIARQWNDQTIPLSEARILFPFLVSLFFLALYGLNNLQQSVRRYSAMGATLLAGIYMSLACGSIVGNMATVRPYIEPLLISRYNGLGLQGAWQDPALGKMIDQLGQLPGNATCFSDDTQRLYFFTGRSSSYIGDLKPEDFELVREALHGQDVLVVFFHDSSGRLQILQEQFHQMELVYRDDSGRLVFYGRRVP